MISVYNFSQSKSINYPSLNNINLCLGFFDGMHLGHQYLIKESLKDNKNTYVLTFSGFLKADINSSYQKEVLTSIEDRIEILDKLNVKGLFIIPFTKEIKELSPKDFIKIYLKPLNIKKIYVGKDFTFGKNGQGKVDDLKKEFDVKVVDFLQNNNQKISAKNIISLLKEGEITKANQLLGRNYAIKGEVIHGLQNGRKIDFPTANIEPLVSYVIPKDGVYATKITINKHTYLSMTNIGTHPTIDELIKPSIETNIFNFHENIYHYKVKLEFLYKVREQIKFENLDKLKSQLILDKLAIIKNQTN